MISWLRKVTFTCTHCGYAKAIPLRRVHVFERFHQLQGGQAVLIRCPRCARGLQIPTPYTGHTGHCVAVDPHNPPREAFIHEAVC